MTGRLLLLIDHLSGHAAIYGYVGTIDEIVVRERQEDAQAGNILRCADALGWVLEMVGLG